MCRACGSRRKLATRSARRARVELFVAIGVKRQHGQARRVAREIVEKLSARVVGPLQIVDDYEQVSRGREQLEQLDNCVKKTRLARLG